jgi:hypothetical protein
MRLFGITSVLRFSWAMVVLGGCAAVGTACAADVPRHQPKLAAVQRFREAGWRHDRARARLVVAVDALPTSAASASPNMMPEWLSVLATVAVALGVGCALVVLLDRLFHVHLSAFRFEASSDFV